MQIQQVYVAEAALSADAAERRAPVRAEHLERLNRLISQEVVQAAGAFDDLSASLLVLHVIDEQAAREIIEDDIYWRTGVWTGVTIRRLNRVVPDATGAA